MKDISTIYRCKIVVFTQLPVEWTVKVMQFNQLLVIKRFESSHLFLASSFEASDLLNIHHIQNKSN